MQRVCGPKCAAEDAKRKREKQDRKELAEGRLALKSRSAWLARSSSGRQRSASDATSSSHTSIGSADFVIDLSA